MLNYCHTLVFDNKLKTNSIKNSPNYRHAKLNFVTFDHPLVSNFYIWHGMIF